VPPIVSLQTGDPIKVRGADGQPASALPALIVTVTKPKKASGPATALASANLWDTGKAKALTAGSSVEPDVVEPGEMMPAEPSQPMSPLVAESTAPTDKLDPSAGAASTVITPSVHIALASYSEPAPATQLVTLADLKRSLRHQAMDERSRFIREAINDKTIRLDVVRSRF
jgi:hypothetical protein